MAYRRVKVFIYISNQCRDRFKLTKITEKEIEIAFKSPTSLFWKIFAFYRWSRIASALINEKKYDNLIILSTYPAVLLHKLLIKKYNHKYIFDIRDYSMEAFRPFRKRVMSIIEHSTFTTVSSKGYLRWLEASEKIYLNHNATHFDYEVDKQVFFENKDKINITFVGNVRLDGQTRAMMVDMKDSSKYSFGYIGRMLRECDLDNFCSNQGIRHVFKKGVFTDAEKVSIYADVDIVNAVYANHPNHIRLADSTPLPNRVYDTVAFKCPIVASKGTYLAELIEEYNLGFSINGFDRDLEKQFDSYINQFDKKAFLDGCDRFMNVVKKDESILKLKMLKSLKEWDNQ